MTLRRCILLLALALYAFLAFATGNSISQQELVQRTQEMFAAVAGGDQAPWKKYVADDCMYFNEVGRKMNKADVVADVTPLPQGYSGTITVANEQTHIEGDVAILSYDLDETETIFGQKMTARYHGTDTWMRRNGDWQIVAGQIFRYYEDPAAGDVEAGAWADYAGTYELAPGKTLTVTLEGKQLFRQRGDGAKVELIPEAAPIFFRKGVEGRILFHRGQNGKVDTLIDRRNNEDVVWKKVK